MFKCNSIPDLLKHFITIFKSQNESSNTYHEFVNALAFYVNRIDSPIKVTAKQKKAINRYIRKCVLLKLYPLYDSIN